ncbi:P-loop NTPase [Desulfohalobium retbaense]|uniref:Cobyrinic acid ac-diamide synthase n=1 Tax=Desulfohalobium retbaense (strain ATCC 49708 / DSM 5692 / JCM 16813 / HR100) TaxID=485915 RepID=C8X0B4_DESRD|nr:ATP-binding protein [Desulfohalobium retbaense]ACV67739.1 Cobyrinic acid ac-diamide synthase [Desulfohalobium retbaense DSM 5692]
MRIAIASGKGGTGKTTVTTNLAAYVSQNTHGVSLVDCDVEEPNAQFFLDAHWEYEEAQHVPVPAIDQETCLGSECRQCVEACRFKALIWMVDEVMVFPELCHSCGLCETICPVGAVGQSHRTIGDVRQGSGHGVTLTGGLMRVGEAMAPPLIQRVKAKAPETAEVTIYDCPPGTSCPVIEALDGADYTVLVTEPTPFGLYDLQLAVGLLRKLGKPFGVVLNRDGMGDDRVLDYLEAEGIDLLARLPHSTEAAAAYSRGELLVEALPEMQQAYADLWSGIVEHMAAEKETV